MTYRTLLLVTLLSLCVALTGCGNSDSGGGGVQGASAGTNLDDIPEELSYIELPHRMEGLSANFSPDGKKVVTTSRTISYAQIWDTKTGLELHRLSGINPQHFAPFFSHDGKKVFTGAGVGHDNTLKIWDAHSGEELRRLKGEGNPAFYAAAVSPDNKTIVAGAALGAEIYIWDIETGRELHRIEEHSGVFGQIFFLPDGKRVAACSTNDNFAIIWDTVSGRELHRLKGNERERDPSVRLHVSHNSVGPIALSPDGKRILTLGREQRTENYSDYFVNTIKFWDADTGREIHEIEFERTWEVSDVVFSPDGKNLIAIMKRPLAFGSQVKILDSDSGKAIREWEDATNGHFGFYQNMIVLPITHSDNSDSWRYDVQFRCLDTGREHLVLKGNASSINSVSFSLDGRKVATASDDNTVRIWTLPRSIVLDDAPPTEVEIIIISDPPPPPVPPTGGTTGGTGTGGEGEGEKEDGVCTCNPCCSCKCTCGKKWNKVVCTKKCIHTRFQECGNPGGARGCLCHHQPPETDFDAWLLYEDKEYGFSFRYPRNWELEINAPDVMVVGHSTGKIKPQMDVEVFDIVENLLNLSKEDLFEELDVYYSEAVEFKEFGTRKIGGKDARFIHQAEKGEVGLTGLMIDSELIRFVLNHRGETFIITASATQNDFAVNRPIFDRIFESFQFVEGAAPVGNLTPAEDVPAPQDRAANTPKISLDKAAYSAGEKITVTSTGITSVMISADAFVAIYDKDAAHGAYGQYRYPTTATATLEFDAPRQEGDYEMRLYNRDHVYTDATFEMKVPFKVGR